jgi:hypothetical protein
MAEPDVAMLLDHAFPNALAENEKHLGKSRVLRAKLPVSTKRQLQNPIGVEQKSSASTLYQELRGK